jgi:hypothetical protein
MSAILNDTTSNLAETSSRSIAKLAVTQSLCDDAARAALNLRHRVLAACLRRAAELTPTTLAITGARQRLAWGRLLQPVARHDSATDFPTDTQCSTCVDAAWLLSRDLIEMCGERVSMPWASASVCVEMAVDS